MLGTLRAVAGDKTIIRFRTRRVASLLGYLALNHHRVLSRDTLADLLWPDTDFEVARRNLRQALYGLRQVLEFKDSLSGRVLVPINDGIQLNPEEIATDVEQFEALVRQGREDGEVEILRKAVDLYKGPLLAGLQDAWIIEEQARLEDLYVQVQGEIGEQSNNPQIAIDHLLDALKIDPLQERWQQVLLSRFLESGQIDRAAEQFRGFEIRLREELDREPSAETSKIWSNIERARDSIQSRQIVRIPHIANRTFGREDALSRTAELIIDGPAPMLTLIGPAGVGKTRLATECGGAIAKTLGWNVVFVPLAETGNPAAIFEVIAAALNLTSISAGSELSAIAREIGGNSTLLILDNLEQIAAEAGPYVSKLLAEIPSLRILGTSRQSLQIQEEQLFHLDPLHLPAPEQSASDIVSVPSVQLFIDRCRTLRPDLKLDEESLGAIVDLCIRFEGLPLALEIAAGLTNTVSPAQMAKFLPDSQIELVNRRADAPERHRTLKTAIEWGFLSTPPELHRLFLNLSVFRGGFDLESAAAICADRPEAILTSINALIERSLLRRQPDRDLAKPRFELLTAFREYAEQETSPRDLTKLRQKHAIYFSHRVPPDRPFRSVAEQTDFHLGIEADYENFLSAIDFAIGAGNLELAVDLLNILSTVWLTRGPRVAERDLIRRIEGHPKVSQMSPAAKIRLLRMVGTTLIRSADYEAAYAKCEKAIQIAQEINDSSILATCYSGLSVCAGYLGRMDECRELCLQVLDLVGDENLTLAERSHLGIGSVSLDRGELDEASREFAQARKISARLRGGEPDALIVLNQANVACLSGKYEEAAATAVEAIRISKRLKDDFTVAMALTVIVRCQMRQGEVMAAEATNREALDKFRRGDFAYWMLKCLRTQALIFAHLGEFKMAAILLSATSEVESDEETDELSISRERIDQGLSRREIESARAKGLGMTSEEAYQLIGQL